MISGKLAKELGKEIIAFLITEPVAIKRNAEDAKVMVSSSRMTENDEYQPPMRR